MINHSALASKLNIRLYKDSVINEEDSSIPQLEKPLVDSQICDSIIEEEPLPLTKKIDTHHIINYIEFIFNIVCFGFAAQVVLNASWPIIGMIAVGYTINFIFNKILFLFSS